MVYEARQEQQDEPLRHRYRGGVGARRDIHAQRDFTFTLARDREPKETQADASATSKVHLAGAGARTLALQLVR